MALWLVNETPPTRPLKPSGLVQFSIKSDSTRPRLGTLLAKFGISRLQHAGVLPDLDPNLLKYGKMSWVSPENTLPLTGECLRSLSSGRVVITKETSDTADQGVYEYRVPVDPGMSSLAYFKFRKYTWQIGARPWVAAGDVTGLRFGLKAGLLRTSCDVFLRDDGADGALMACGPINGLSRGNEVDHPFAWKTLADGDTIELLVFLNHAPSTPVFEVWGRLGSGSMALVATVALATLATDSAFADSSVTAYFGNGGFPGDVLDMEDWGLYPDFREVVREAETLPGNSLVVLPDAPTVYAAAEGRLPEEALAPWAPIGNATAAYGYAPGRRAIPQNIVINKFGLSDGVEVPTSVRVGYRRYEPRIGARASGFMAEAFMSGFAKHVDVETFGAGISVNDGLYSYRAIMYKASLRNSIVIQKSRELSTLSSQYDSGKDLNWEDMKLVRLILDRDRSTVALWVDEEKIVSAPLGSNFPRSRDSSVEFGHVVDAVTLGQVNVGFINYLTQYQAYEATDGVDPFNSVLEFDHPVAGTTTTTTADGILKIEKKDIHVRGSKSYYFKAASVDVSSGALLDVRARVPIFWDRKGTPMASAADTGVGFGFHLGSKKIHLGFYNCGVHGKRIGILPGAGSEKDIIEQTALGRRYSAPVDWTKMETYRLVLRAYDKIEVWAGLVTNKPAIVIPWVNDTDGFGLPFDVIGQPSGVFFGHTDGLAASTSEWEFVRWGTSSGYDISVSQGYDGGLKEYHYGGKSLLLTDIEEDT